VPKTLHVIIFPTANTSANLTNKTCSRQAFLLFRGIIPLGEESVDWSLPVTGLACEVESLTEASEEEGEVPVINKTFSL